MKSLSAVFQHSDKLQKIVTKTNKGIRSERDELMAKFQGHGIQITDATTKKYRDASLAEIAKILCYCPTADLHAFHQDCMKANHFAKFFWWAVRGRQIK